MFGDIVKNRRTAQQKSLALAQPMDLSQFIEDMLRVRCNAMRMRRFIIVICRQPQD
jgi:hypothetical protein